MAAFDGKEVGQCLARCMLPCFDPLLKADTRPTAVVPALTHFKTTLAWLPGGLQVLATSVPQTLTSDGRSLITGSVESLRSGKPYMELQLCPKGLVQSLVCISQVCWSSVWDQRRAVEVEE